MDVNSAAQWLQQRWDPTCSRSIAGATCRCLSRCRHCWWLRPRLGLAAAARVRIVNGTSAAA
eukprot:1663213-Prymnesium_polylepis.1